MSQVNMSKIYDGSYSPQPYYFHTCLNFCAQEICWETGRCENILPTPVKISMKTKCANAGHMLRLESVVNASAFLFCLIWNCANSSEALRPHTFAQLFVKQSIMLMMTSHYLLQSITGQKQCPVNHDIKF